jgi:hypothetical protein
MEFAAHLVALGQFVAHMYCSFVVLISIHVFIFLFSEDGFYNVWNVSIIDRIFFLVRCSNVVDTALSLKV